MSLISTDPDKRLHQSRQALFILYLIVQSLEEDKMQSDSADVCSRVAD